MQIESVVEVDVSEAADGFRYAATWEGKMEQLVNGVVDHDDIEPMAMLCAQVVDDAAQAAEYENIPCVRLMPQLLATWDKRYLPDPDIARRIVECGRFADIAERGEF